jgi:hypothetical protein
VGEGALGARQRLAAHHAQARRLHRQRTPDHELRLVAHRESRRHVDQHFVRERRHRRDLLRTADHHAVGRFADHAQRQVGVVARAGRAVDLRVADRVRDAQVVAAAVGVVVRRVVTELRIDLRQGLAVVVQADHHVGHEVGHPRQLAPAVLHPQVRVGPLGLQLLFGAGQRIRAADAIGRAVLRLGHRVAQIGAVLQVVQARHLVAQPGKRRVLGHVDAAAVEPHLA